MSAYRRVLLSVESAARVYRMGEVDVAALSDASLDVFEGEFLAIVGPSGSGKSTLLNLIGGMDRPTDGRVVYHDPDPSRQRDLALASDAQVTRYRRREIGFVFQFFNLVPTLTAVENVQVATEIAAQPMGPREALGLVGLDARADHFPAQMSGGEQQRVAIARAVAGNPRFILCDEPTGALDSETGRQILALLCRLRTELGKTVVLITHNTVIARVADRVVHLRDGRIASVEENATPAPAEAIRW